MELFDKPGIIIKEDNSVIRTTKVKKYITKNKVYYKEVRYLENLSNDFKEVERALKEMENSYLGLSPLKEKIVETTVKNNNHYYCFWDKCCKGWYDSELNDLSDWSFNDKDRFILIGETTENESLSDAHKRLWRIAINIK